MRKPIDILDDFTCDDFERYKFEDAHEAVVTGQREALEAAAGALVEMSMVMLKAPQDWGDDAHRALSQATMVVRALIPPKETT